jgi:hypothetical protein
MHVAAPEEKKVWDVGRPMSPARDFLHWRNSISNGLISKSWKVRYDLAAPVIGPLPRQGLITGCMPFYVTWMEAITEYMILLHFMWI